MKNRLVAVSLLLAAGLFFGGRLKAGPTDEKVTLELLNPMGVIELEPYLALRPRLSDYSAKKIALVHNIKPGVQQLFDILEEMLKQKYPGVTIQRGFNPGIPAQAQEEHFKEIAKGCDAFVYAMGD
ncbi:MAG: hypothetical protein AMJ79_02340 [Phycisphaerae bacterium SM23_30]|jgi:hypothetical protein|nr:MAG: hypothetical protein AMJ79_02340 [Phycisphaerae bacterium SM23_30]